MSSVPSVTTDRPGPPWLSGASLLVGAARLWFVIAALGQMTFLYYIVGFYARPTLGGDFANWNKRNLITGYVSGDESGNLFFAAHVLVAALITAGGLLQLVPQIRARAPSLHRWNGRLYLFTVFFMALGGLWLVWVRGSYLTLTGAIGISLNAVLIMTFASLALRYARERRFNVHRRWALRTFVVASGVWFQRIGYMAWMIINQGPVGISKQMDGPFDLVWGYACYLLPLAILELYLLAAARAGVRGRLAMACVLLVMTAVMGVGIIGAYMFMWRPVL